MEPNWDLAAQPASVYWVDQNVNFYLREMTTELRCGVGCMRYKITIDACQEFPKLGNETPKTVQAKGVR